MKADTKYTPEWVLERARKLRYDYSDEIPSQDKILHNIHATHKISIGYWQHVSATLQNSEKAGYVGNNYYNRFREHFKSEIEGKFTSQKSIDFVNSLLEEFIAELEIKVLQK